MGSMRCIALSDGQLICLELISQNLTSKEIGAQLGISPHTVDQRVRRALRILGAADRRQAARLVVRPRQATDQSGRQLAWNIADATSIGSPPTNAGQFSAGLQMPFATPAQPTNRMGVAQRLLWIVAIAVAAALSSSMYLAGLESLARLFADLARPG